MTYRPISLVVALSATVAAFEACSSSSGSPNIFGDDASASSSGSGGASSSGSSSGSGSGSGAATSSSSGSGSTNRVPSNVTFNDAGIPLCGTTACDLKTNECCLTPPPYVATCNPQGTTCPGQAIFNCVDETDCPSGEVCCGVANETAGTAGTECQDIASNNNQCSPAPSATMASAQVCQTTAECKNGMTCTWQDCTVGSGVVSLAMCGVQSGAVFNCTKH